MNSGLSQPPYGVVGSGYASQPFRPPSMAPVDSLAGKKVRVTFARPRRPAQATDHCCRSDGPRGDDSGPADPPTAHLSERPGSPSPHHHSTPADPHPTADPSRRPRLLVAAPPPPASRPVRAQVEGVEVELVRAVGLVAVLGPEAEHDDLALAIRRFEYRTAPVQQLLAERPPALAQVVLGVRRHAL